MKREGGGEEQRAKSAGADAEGKRKTRASRTHSAENYTVELKEVDFTRGRPKMEGEPGGEARLLALGLSECRIRARDGGG